MVFEMQSPLPVSCLIIMTMNIGCTKTPTAKSGNESTIMRKKGTFVRRLGDFQNVRMTEALTEVAVMARIALTTQATMPFMVKAWDGELRTNEVSERQCCTVALGECVSIWTIGARAFPCLTSLLMSLNCTHSVFSCGFLFFFICFFVSALFAQTCNEFELIFLFVQES